MSYFRVYSLFPLCKTCQNCQPAVASSATYCLSQRSSSDEGPESRGKPLPEHRSVSSLQECGWSTWYLNISGAIRWERAAHELFSSKLSGTEGQKMTACLIPILSQSPHAEYWWKVTGQEVILSRGYANWPRPHISEMIRTRVSQWRYPRLCLSKLPSHYTVWIWRSLPKCQNRECVHWMFRVCGHALWKQGHSGHLRDDDLANFV